MREAALSRNLLVATVERHREDASTAPRNTRVPGSPEWCYQTMTLLKSSYRHIHIDQEHFTHYLNELREHRAWEKVPVDHPYGTEEKMLVAELGKRVDEITAELSAAKHDLRQQERKSVAQELDAETPSLKDVGHPGSNSNTQKNDISFGTSAAYAIAKLRKDRPDIHRRVLDGELTANAGMIEAGFRKKRPSQKLSIVDRMLRLWLNASDAERTQFMDLTKREAA